MKDNERNEMNLFELICWCCRGIARFFKWCGVSLLHLVRFSVQNVWVVLAFVAIFGVLGFFMTKPAHTIYNGGATILYYEEAGPLVHDYFNRLNLYCTSPELASNIGLPDSLHKKILKIETFRWIDCKHDGTPDLIDYDNSDKYLTDTADVIMRDRLYVSIKTKGINDMAGIQTWLQEYFDSSREMTALTEQGRRALSARLNACNREISRLDSLSNYDYFKNDKNNIVEVKDGLLLNRGKQLYYNDILKMISRRAHLETAIDQRPHAINFQNDLLVTSALPRLVSIVIWLLAGYIVGVLVALCLVYRRQIGNYMRKK